MNAFYLGFLLVTINEIIGLLVGYMITKKLFSVFPAKVILLRWFSLSVIISIFLGILFFYELDLNSIVYSVILIMYLSFIPSFDFFIIPFFNLLSKSIKIDKPLMDWVAHEFHLNIRVAIMDREITNAYATGIIPYSRTILIGGPLINQMDESEIKSLIAHEVGHVKRHHLPIMYLSNLLLVFASFMLFSQFGHYYDTNKIYFILVCMFFGVLTVTIPGLVQRRLEHDADHFAASKVGSDQYIRMLNRFNELTNKGLEKISINYPTLKQRIGFVNKKLKV